jgi:hypothetical protein
MASAATQNPTDAPWQHGSAAGYVDVMKQKTNIEQLISALPFIVLMTLIPACATQSGSNQTAQVTPQSATSPSPNVESPIPITGIDSVGRVSGW